jgi:hypothetical protein
MTVRNFVLRILPHTVTVPGRLTWRNYGDKLSITRMGTAVANSVEETIGSILAEVPAVERVYVSHYGNSVRVMTLINDDEDDVYDQIYVIERRLIRDHPTYDFDFRVVARRGRPEEEFMYTDAPVWQRENSRHLCSAS